MSAKSHGRHPGKGKLDLEVRGQSDPRRGLFLLYLVAMMLVLWFWQDAVNPFTVRTISYSEFKTYVGSHEVVECTIKQLKRGSRVEGANDLNDRPPSGVLWPLLFRRKLKPTYQWRGFPARYQAWLLRFADEGVGDVAGSTGRARSRLEDCMRLCPQADRESCSTV